MNTLIITKSFNEIKLIKAIKTLTGCWLHEARAQIYNLPTTLYLNASKEEVNNLLNGIAEYTYEVYVPSEENSTLSKEDLDYLEARSWYNSLDEYEQNMIDILIKSSIPRACCG